MMWPSSSISRDGHGRGMEERRQDRFEREAPPGRSGARPVWLVRRDADVVPSHLSARTTTDPSTAPNSWDQQLSLMAQTSDAMADDADGEEPVYYVISDPYIGGDEQLEHVEFLDELLAFLERPESTDENAELIINGDAFGLWEFTTIDGPAKFDVPRRPVPRWFVRPNSRDRRVGPHHVAPRQPRPRTGSLRRIRRALCRVQRDSRAGPVDDPTQWRAGDPLRTRSPAGPQQRNRRLGQSSRDAAGVLLQHAGDEQGRTALRPRPVQLAEGRPGGHADRTDAGLAALEVLLPRDEPGPAVRAGAVPVAVQHQRAAGRAGGLDLAGVWSMPVDQTEAFVGQFTWLAPRPGSCSRSTSPSRGCWYSSAFRCNFIRRDARKTIQRFGVFETALTVDAEAPYAERVHDIVDERPETAVYCYGHTHRPNVQTVDGRLLVNTGTWLKRLHRRDGVIGILPPVFYPSYQLVLCRPYRGRTGGRGRGIRGDQEAESRRRRAHPHRTAPHGGSRARPGPPRPIRRRRGGADVGAQGGGRVRRRAMRVAAHRPAR